MNEPVGLLFVIDELWQWGGAEASLLKILRRLPGERFRPRVVTFRFNDAVKGFQPFPCPLEVYPLRRIYGRNSLPLALRLGRLIRAERIRIVHTFFESSDLWAGPTARLAGKVVLISSRRDVGIQRSRLHDALYRLVGPLFDQVQAVSEEVRQWVIRADHLDPARVVTIPNGIELEAVPVLANPAAVRARYALPDEGPLIACVANIRRVKGIDVLVRAAARVSRELPSARFLVAGQILEPDYFAELERMAGELGAGANVRFLGRVEGVMELLSVADAFFLPSRSEGMSNALLEAMACSLPAVATRVGGNPELVRDGESGFLVASEDAAAAADRLLELLRWPERARQMGRCARRRIESEFSMEAVIGRLTAEYARLLAAAGLTG